MRFNDDAYLQEFKQSGKFPKIHDDIYFTIVKNIKDKDITVLDLGSCTGLLTVRLSKYFNEVIGVEASKVDMNKSIIKQNTTYLNTDINDISIQMIIDVYKPKLIVCRRVLPEISNNNEQEFCKFVDTITENKIEYLAIEGRQLSKNSVHFLSSIDKEISFFYKYRVIDKFKNVAILKYNEIL